MTRGLYTSNTADDAAEVVRRNLPSAVAAFFPEAVIADRSARLGGVPAADGSFFVVHSRSSELELPGGIVVRPRRGPGAVAYDMPWPGGLYLSSEARALLDNARLSRSRRGRLPRTLTREELGEWIDSLAAQRGEHGMNRLRDRAHEIAAVLDREEELAIVDRLIGAALGTRAVSGIRSRRFRARAAGRPYDVRRADLFARLADALERVPPIVRPLLDGGDRYRFLPFFEAYFSNFIEGTEFTVDEAAEIVFERVIPSDRPADAHDILGTYEAVADRAEMSQVPSSAGELLSLLRRRHARVLGERPDARPGEFKLRANRVGAIEFVEPELVAGTLVEAFEPYLRLRSAFARAAFQMFVVAEVHPFDDGNGRIARIMMNAELEAAREQRIIIPQVYSNNYLAGLRGMSVNGNADGLVATLDFAQRYTSSIDFSDFERARRTLETTNAFRDPLEEQTSGIRLRLPDAA